MSNISGLNAYKEKLDAGLIERSAPKNPIEKHREKPRSLRLAINAKCYDCVGFQRTEIKLCEMTDCPLWHVRPYQEK